MDIVFKNSREIFCIIRLAIPFILYEMIEHFMVLVDLIIAGRLGVLEFAAVSLAGEIFWVFILICITIFTILSVFVSEEASKKKNIESVFAVGDQGIWLVVFLSIPFGVATWFLGDIVAMTNQSPEILTYVEEYSRALFWSLFPTLGVVWIRSCANGLGKPDIVVWVALGMLPVNVALSIWFVFGGLGIEGMGVAGAGYATSAASLLMFIILYFYGRRHKIISTNIIKNALTKSAAAKLFNILRVGTAHAAIQMMENFMFICSALIVGSISAIALSAHNVVFAILEVGIIIAVGIGEAGMLRMATHIAEKNNKLTRQCVQSSLLMGTVTMGIIALILVVFPQQVSSIFIDADDEKSEEVLNILYSFIYIAALSLVVDGFQTICNRMIRSLKETIFPTIYSFIGYWIIGIGLGFYLSVVKNIGIQGIWISFTLGFFIISALMAAHLIFILRRSYP